MSALFRNCAVATTIMAQATCAWSAPVPDLELGLVERCRLAVTDVAENPSATGHWFVDRTEAGTFLCLYGSGDWGDLTELLRLLDETDPGVVVVRSTGGPVEVWLTLAEQLAADLHTVVVDEACFSSCANYMIPLGTRVVAAPGSLVVWHGGLSDETIDLFNAAGSSDIETVISNEDLLARTIRLYEARGVDPRILADTNPAATDVHVAGAFAMMPPFGGRSVTVSGFALSPERLRSCYGFGNVDEMWHAGGNDEVVALSRRRSSDLVVLESPFGDNGACD